MNSFPCWKTGVHALVVVQHSSAYHQLLMGAAYSGYSKKGGICYNYQLGNRGGDSINVMKHTQQLIGGMISHKIPKIQHFVKISMRQKEEINAQNSLECKGTLIFLYFGGFQPTLGEGDGSGRLAQISNFSWKSVRGRSPLTVRAQTSAVTLKAKTISYHPFHGPPLKQSTLSEGDRREAARGRRQVSNLDIKRLELFLFQFQLEKRDCQLTLFFFF